MMPEKSSRPQDTLVLAAACVGTVMVVFTVGYHWAGWTWSDAFYMVIITAFGVGYNEVQPVDTLGLRIWTVALIVLGGTGTIFVTGALVQWLTESQIQRALGTKRMESEIEKLKNHVIVCGYGRIGRMVASQLEEGGMPFIVLDRDAERVAEAQADGWLAMQGDANDEEVLNAVGIKRARVLATVLPNDAANVFITLSVRNMNPSIHIIARGEVPSTERKLMQAGANRVVLPAHIGADRVAHLILHPHAEELLGGKTKASVDFEHYLSELGLEMHEIEIGPASGLAFKTVAEVEGDTMTNLLVLAILRPDGKTELHPPPHTRLTLGSALVVMKRCARA